MRFRDRFDRSKRQSSTRRQRIGFAFFWLLVVAYAYVIPQEANWNTESHLFLTFSLVEHHTPSIDAYHVRLGDESYDRGHYYSDKAPGLSLLAVPIYFGLKVLDPHLTGHGYLAFSGQRYAIPRDTVIIRYAVTYLVVIVPSALLGVLFWLLLMQFMAGEIWALAVASVYSLGTIAYVYSTQFFSHQVAAVLLFVAFALLFMRVRFRDASARSYAAATIAGLCAGYAVISEYPTALIALALGVYLLAIARQRLKTALFYLAGMVPAAAVAVVYDLAAFGQPLAVGYAHVHSAAYQVSGRTNGLGLAGPWSYGIQLPTLESIWQITFGTYRGIFLLSPVLLLFFAAIVEMWKRRDLRPELWLCLSIVILYFLMDASRGSLSDGWSGGSSVASRHLTPMLPFMVMPLVFGLRNVAFRVAFVALGLLSTALIFMSVMTGDEFSMTDQNPLMHQVLPKFFGGHLIATWGMLFGLTGLLGLVPLAAVAAALIARLAYLFAAPVQVSAAAPDRGFGLETS